MTSESNSNFSSTMLPLTVALGLKSNGKPDMATVCDRKLEKGYHLVSMCQVNPAVDPSYLEVREKFIRSLSDIQRAVFAKLENRPGLLLFFGRYGDNAVVPDSDQAPTVAAPVTPATPVVAAPVLPAAPTVPGVLVADLGTPEVVPTAPATAQA